MASPPPPISSILIVDPKITLGKPYNLLPTTATTLHVTSTAQAAQYLRTDEHQLVIISASFSPHQMVGLLEILKDASAYRRHLIPLIIMVDLENKINFVPGTLWAEKIGIVCSLSSQQEVDALMYRLGLP